MSTLEKVSLEVILIPKRINPAELKEKKSFDPAVTSNVINNNQCDDAMEYDPKFDYTFSLSSGTKEPLPVVTVSLGVGKKHRATIISGLKCLWDNRATNIMIKIQHTKPYNL